MRVINRRRRVMRSLFRILLVAVAIAIASSAQAVLTLQYDTWPPSDPVINTGSRGGSGAQRTPAEATIVAGPPVESGFAVHFAADNGGPGSGIDTGYTTGQLGIQAGSFTAGAWVNLDAIGGDQMV